MAIGEESNSDIVNAAINESMGGGDATQTPTTPADSGSQTDNANSQATNSGSEAGTGSPTDAQSSEQQGGDPKAQANRARRVRDDGQGNLVDEQGRLIASRGSERRWYSEAQAAVKQARQTQRELEVLQGRVEPLQQAFATFANLQMPPQDIAIGAQLYKAFLTNPKSTIEYLLTEAQKNGVQVEGMSGGVDIAAIRGTIQDLLKPILADREEQQRDREADAAAEREVQEFRSAHEFGAMHEDEIALIIKQNPQYTLSEAYLRLENAALRAGLDFTRPLREQWIARQNGGRQQPSVTHTGTANGSRPSVPLPNGRTASNASPMSSARAASPNQSNADIVREALREFGLH